MRRILVSKPYSYSHSMVGTRGAMRTFMTCFPLFMLSVLVHFSFQSCSTFGALFLLCFISYGCVSGAFRSFAFTHIPTLLDVIHPLRVSNISKAHQVLTFWWQCLVTVPSDFDSDFELTSRESFRWVWPALSFFFLMPV